ncbi:DUF2141 domain-containing protein [Litorimonas sp. RW-G-Af-16]|uniref:DUF2141 domain-containing protein n=1 Tax=Litorimonas sp. RW-G-Af-16 TaxID=3241168 RepID=UPI00390C6AD6
MTHTNTSRFLKSSIALAASATALAMLSQAPAFAASKPPTTSQLTIKITGFEDQSGQVLIALFNSADSYDSETAFRDAKIAVTQKTVKTSFDDLPAGTYAFKLFHDADGDGELDTDGFGIPSEDYYFSNDASDPFSAPEWDEAQFDLTKAKVTKRVRLD